MRQLTTVVALSAGLLGGCAGSVSYSEWMDCERAAGPPSRAAQIGGAVGTILVGPVGGLVGVAMDGDRSQAVQDCRNALMERAK